jgi:GNAT superfamily N-acetyltransferase
VTAAERLTAGELRRIDMAEARLYERLYAAASPTLGTGSRRFGDMLAIWYPTEREAGYNYLMNFHLAPDPDLGFELGLTAIRRAGAAVFSIPVDERVSTWATDEKIRALGLTHESDENIWARRIDPAHAGAAPPRPLGFDISTEAPPEADLARTINFGWGLPVDHTRGKLFACAVRLPDWHVIIARHDGAVAGVTILVEDGGIAYLLLSVVRPKYRGRGLQTFFIQHRLHVAADHGCDLAVTETNDDNASPRNMQRAGFHLAVQRRVYARRFDTPPE